MAQPVQVECYSGRVYAERPVSFRWEGEAYGVQQVEREWLEPGERHFLVRTDELRFFELCYHEQEDQWSGVEIVKGV